LTAAVEFFRQTLLKKAVLATSSLERKNIAQTTIPMKRGDNSPTAGPLFEEALNSGKFQDLIRSLEPLEDNAIHYNTATLEYLIAAESKATDLFSKVSSKWKKVFKNRTKILQELLEAKEVLTILKSNVSKKRADLEVFRRAMAPSFDFNNDLGKAMAGFRPSDIMNRLQKQGELNSTEVQTSILGFQILALNVENLKKAERTHLPKSEQGLIALENKISAMLQYINAQLLK